MMEYEGKQLGDWKLSNPKRRQQDGSMLSETLLSDYGTSSRRPEQYPEDNLQGDHYLTSTARHNRGRGTATQLANEFFAATDISVLGQTIYRQFNETDLSVRRRMVCIPFNVGHRRSRFNRCRQHQHWTREQWANVLFTDAFRFSMNDDSQRVHIYKESGTRYHSPNIMETHHYEVVVLWSERA